MIAPKNRKSISIGFIATAGMLFVAASAVADDKPKPAPHVAAPAAKAPTPAKTPSAPSHTPGGSPGGGAHGPATTGGGTHGPTATGGGTHGPTTTTTGGSHGLTTTGGGTHGPTTTGGGASIGKNPSTGAPGGGHNVNTGTTHGPGNTPGVVHNNPAISRGGPGGGRPMPRDSRVVQTRSGNEVRMRSNGRPGDVHVANRGMDIHHGLNGSRRVVVERGNHSRVFAERGGRGYVQRPYSYHGREYAHRTYYYHGRAYDRFYRGYPYHGVYLEAYSPSFYYAPGFYGWAYNPWAAPIVYAPGAWGWVGNPWYGYYGAYFTPYPVYPSASYWLTDYMISTTLAASYQARVDAAQAQNQQQAQPPLSGDIALTPEVKNLISAEVQRQIALENAEAQNASRQVDQDPASSGVQRMLTDGVQHVFLAGRYLDLVDGGGAECGISEGDALQLSGPVASDAIAANLVVLSSKGGQECRRGVTVSVAFADLQEMQNHMRETIDQGMAELQSKQSKGGLPALPQSARAAPVKADFAADPSAPGPDPNAATEINQQMQEADKAEQATLAETAQGSDVGGGQSAPVSGGQGAAVGGAPPTVSLGQSIEEVTSIMGTPKSIVDLGAKKIYVYKDMKITFTNGKVADVQ